MVKANQNNLIFIKYPSVIDQNEGLAPKAQVKKNTPLVSLPRPTTSSGLKSLISCLTWDKTFENRDVWTHTFIPITAI